MIAKILLTLLVVIVWFMLMTSNLLAAGHTATRMHDVEGIPLKEAQSRTTPIVFGWMAALTVLAVLALVLIW